VIINAVRGQPIGPENSLPPSHRIVMINQKPSVLILLVSILAATLLIKRFRRARGPSNVHPLPPSPPSYPLVGNLFSLPLAEEHKAYTELGKQLKSKGFNQFWTIGTKMTMFAQTM
jgi:hypothetical protein